MKKKFTLTLGLLAFFLFGIAQTASLNLAKSFHLDKNPMILLDLPSEANIVIWEKSHVNVAIQIEVENLSQKIADELGRVGRYDLVADSQNGALHITSPNTHKKVRIGGHELKETMTYTVYVPKNVKLKFAVPNSGEVAVNR